MCGLYCYVVKANDTQLSVCNQVSYCTHKETTNTAHPGTQQDNVMFCRSSSTGPCA